MSPSALKHYNKYTDVTININKLLVFKRIIANVISQSTQQFRLRRLIPIIHISSNIIPQPTIACMTSRGINVQYIHQKFDHRNLSIINKMKNLNLMTGMPTKIPNFHYSHDCPICLLSKATKVPRTPYQYKEHYISGKFFCLDFSFWNVISIRGFTSSLSAICMKTRYIFVFPTRNKRPPLATITWFIQTLHRQGYPVLYIHIDKGGELGRSTDF